MKAGLEDKKKVALVSGLFLILGYALYSNVFSGPSSSSSGSSTPAPRARPGAVGEPAIGAPASDAPTRATTSKGTSRIRGEEFIPVLHSKRVEDQIDPNSVDPTLRLDKLAKLQDLAPAGSGRNLFTMGAPPVAKEVGPEPIVKPTLAHAIGPTEFALPAQPGPPPPPPLPPVTFKYYGFSTVRKDGKKAAFFLIGDDVTIKAPGDMVDRFYRLVTIGLTSAVVEDTQSKRTQTVPLAEEAQS